MCGCTVRNYVKRRARAEGADQSEVAVVKRCRTKGDQENIPADSNEIAQKQMHQNHIVMEVNQHQNSLKFQL